MGVEDEKGEAGDLAEKVSGSAMPGANFKDFSNPDGVGDESQDDPNNTGSKMPQDSEKKLPKAGGLA